MKVVILCGGQGTRIRDVNESVPKPMLPIGYRPILWHIMKYYATRGHKEFVLCLGHKGQVIKDFFMNYESQSRDVTITLGKSGEMDFHSHHDEADWKVTLADTGLSSMTGARISRIRQYVQDDNHFMLTYGDGVGDIDIDSLIDFHLRHGKVLTVTGVRPPGRFGELTHDESGKVLQFNEKPQATGGRISGGFFVCNRSIFDYLSDKEDLVFEEDPIRNLVLDHQVMMYPHDGFWQPMDTHRDFVYLNKLVSNGTAPWIRW